MLSFFSFVPVWDHIQDFGHQTNWDIFVGWITEYYICLSVCVYSCFLIVWSYIINWGLCSIRNTQFYAASSCYIEYKFKLWLIFKIKNYCFPLQTVDVFAVVALSGIISRLLGTGTVLVATSNRAPNDLNQVCFKMDFLDVSDFVRWQLLFSNVWCQFGFLV